MKLPRRNFLHLAAGAAALPALSRFAWAQAYPTRRRRDLWRRCHFVDAGREQERGSPPEGCRELRPSARAALAVGPFFASRLPWA
jgi:hypothetical protein